MTLRKIANSWAAPDSHAIYCIVSIPEQNKETSLQLYDTVAYILHNNVIKIVLTYADA